MAEIRNDATLTPIGRIFVAEKNQCINCDGGLIITPAYPVAERTIYCGNCGLTPSQAKKEKEL